MGRLTIACVLSLIVVTISSLPINIKNVDQANYILHELPPEVLRMEDLVSPDEDIEATTDGTSNMTQEVNLINKKINLTNELINNDTALRNVILRSQIRPGQVVTSYAVTLNPDIGGNTFTGELIAQVNIIDVNTREDEMLFHISDDMRINSVRFALAGGSVFRDADFSINDDDLLEIDTGFEATLYTLMISYSGSLSMSGIGLYVGRYGTTSYLGMNLHPTYARRVFPCMDELTETSIVSFTLNNPGYTSIVANSLLEDNSQNEFRALPGPMHLWGMMAHNFININIPTSNVLLYGRTGFASLDAQASVAINYFFNSLNDWTNKPYFETILHQDGRMNIFALPDVNRHWHSLSVVGIWEPYIFMETTHSIKHRYEALHAIAAAMANQWFGYVVYPENWRFEWVITGLKEYAAFEMLRMFQDNPLGVDITLLDINTLFVTEIIQESLLRDSYASSRPLEPAGDLFEEEEILDHLNGVMKYKAPAILRMFRLMLGGPTEDYIQMGARGLLSTRALQSASSWNFIDSVGGEFKGNDIVPDLTEALETWIGVEGYPLLHASLRPGSVFLTQERFSLADLAHENFRLPITYTTSVNPNFNIENVYPQQVTDGTFSVPVALRDDEWILFNIQGQAYYRVRYDTELYERIMDALEDPDRREQIHPLNRATLVDDALNLARSGNLDYESAFELVLTMENEMEYAVWRAFVRNMNFLRKRLEALVYDDDDLDPDIYLRMVRRTIGRVESEIGFYPDPLISEPAMVSLTRGLVMDHACRSNYQPCVAAAIDWFYDPDNNDRVVNPNIPHDIRPAVYCTMIREGDGEARTALNNRLDIEISPYERVVILESLACSSDNNFVSSMLDDTITTNSPYTTEEKFRIFVAVAEASYENAQIALSFLSRRTNEVRASYGGAEKLEELIYHLSENMADGDLSTDFSVWVNSQNNNLDDSQDAALRILQQVEENLKWDNLHMDFIYEWIDENDAPTLAASLVLICLTFILTAFNH